MKAVYLCPNTCKENALEAANELASLLISRGLEVYLADSLCEKENIADLRPAKDRRSFDMAIVLGGDGTILRVASELAGSGTPILGVNLGRMGYLADAELSDLNGILDQVIDGRYTIDNRAVLKGTLNIVGQEHGRCSFNAFNDITLHRGSFGGVLPVEISINHTYMDTFMCDGVIASTPSGSTAYNFSAGGPLINPLAKNIIFTPICAHSVFSRSIVLMENDVLTFRIDPSAIDGRPVLTVDGDHVIELTGRSEIEITLSDITFPLIKTGNRSFYEILQAKMFR